MKKNNFEIVIDKTLSHEGGYVNDPDDAGGETKFGISKRAYPSIDIKSLTRDEAKAIYKHDYWDRCRCDDIDNINVASSIFDFGVNAGVRMSCKLAQAVSGAVVDGVIGNNSVTLINSLDSELFLSKFALAKITRYAEICKRNPKNRKFFYGWVKRALA